MDQQFVLAPQPTTKRIADLGGPDFYPTPEWATVALLENEHFPDDIWECACGDGAMSRVCTEYYRNVKSSDLYDRGFAESGIDFLSSDRRHNAIITNPPFHSAEGFVAAGLRQASKKFALLMRLAFLEGAGRQQNIFIPSPPSTIWIFSERITFYPRGAVRKGSGTTAYAWYVWDKDHLGPTQIKWLPTGYKKGRQNRYDPN